MRRHARRLLRTATVVAALISLLAPIVQTVAPSALRPRTFVSLTFDDANADQQAAATILNRYGLDATFYVPSGSVGLPGYLTQSQLKGLASAGHEIGGHTVTHADLATLPLDEVRRQICNDRVTLSSWGFQVRSFAYPFASSTPEVEAVAAECGYNSARMLGDLRSRFGCPDCSYAETLPPENPYYTRALDQFDSSWTLADLKAGVTNAEATGGWVQFTFHNVCTTSCGELGISQTVLTQFAQWLSFRGLLNTVVRPVGTVVGGETKPVVSGPVAPPPSGGANGVVNPSLEDVGATGSPACWFFAPYGEHSASFSTVSPGRTGSVASQVSMTGYGSGDAKLLQSFDLGACAPGVEPGKSYALRAWYTSTVVTQFAVYLRTTSGGWHYWTSSPWFAGSPSFAEAAWTTPPIPAGHNGISFGLNIFSDGVLVTDDYAIYESSEAPPPAQAPAATVASTPPAAARQAVPPSTPEPSEPPVAPAPGEQPAAEQPASEQPAPEPAEHPAPGPSTPQPPQQAPQGHEPPQPPTPSQPPAPEPSAPPVGDACSDPPAAESAAPCPLPDSGDESEQQDDTLLDVILDLLG